MAQPTHAKHSPVAGFSFPAVASAIALTTNAGATADARSSHRLTQTLAKNDSGSNQDGLTI